MRALPLAVVCLLAAGCRVDPNIVLLERENRQLEDRIYQLEDLLAKAQASAASCGGAAIVAPAARAPAAASLPREASGPILAPPQEPPAAPAEIGPLQPPAVLLPPQAGQSPGQTVTPAPRRKAPQPLSIPGGRNGSDSPRGTQTPQAPPQTRHATPVPAAVARPASPGPGAPAVQDNNRVRQITLHSTLTGGYNADGRPGHEGISILVEPRDGQGRLLNAAAPISVALLDKLVTGPAARVARWDFPADAVAALWQNTPAGQGILLQLTWPGAPPAHGQLRLYVRFTTDDGRNLDAIRDIEVQIAERLGAGWSPTSPKELPAQVESASPLWQKRQVAVEQVPPPQPTPDPVEAAGPPVLNSPDNTASATREPASIVQESPPRADAPATTSPGPSHVSRRRAESPETALKRPVWSPLRR